MSNDKAAATYHPEPTPDEDVIEPLSLADLLALIREATETLETLAEHVVPLRHAAAAQEAWTTVVELHTIADHLGQAWAACRKAQVAAQDLAAVQP